MKTISADITQTVEYLLGKEEAIGSNPIISSNTFMMLVLIVFQLANAMDMHLTVEYIFDAKRFAEGNLLIASAGITGLLYTKFIAAFAVFGLYIYGKLGFEESWKCNAALFFAAMLYSGLMTWWAVMLVSI